jgi:hypothetical protein
VSVTHSGWAIRRRERRAYRTAKAAGHPHTEQMRLQERFHWRDFGHMDLTVTVDDPEMYTVCNENERDLTHLR